MALPHQVTDRPRSERVEIATDRQASALPVPVYGLDIETDTTVSGLDPATSAIVAVAVSGPSDDPLDDRVFQGPEPVLLAELDAHLRNLPPGVIATWNGAGFDLPFIADRAATCGVPTGLELAPDVDHRRKTPLQGHECGYRARWYGHRHLDVYRVYRSDVRAALGVSCGLKSIARLVGLPTVEVDVERLHTMPRRAVAAYVASDARLARLLAARRWPSAQRFVDRL